jgi:hypothetical protein
VNVDLDVEDATPPLLAACFKGNISITSLLLKQKANVGARENILGKKYLRVTLHSG